MTVYVDDMRLSARPKGYRGRGTPRWSHLMADTHDELMSFAEQLGLNPAWLQHEGRHTEHFDVTDTVRTKALKLGATPLEYPHGSGQVLLAKIRSKTEHVTPPSVTAEARTSRPA